MTLLSKCILTVMLAETKLLSNKDLLSSFNKSFTKSTSGRSAAHTYIFFGREIPVGDTKTEGLNWKQ